MGHFLAAGAVQPRRRDFVALAVDGLRVQEAQVVALARFAVVRGLEGEDVAVASGERDHRDL